MRAQAGLTWREFDRETQVFGLATTGGLISTTGIAGLTLGGVGWLMGKSGLACDNLLSVDVVTADGKAIIASDSENQDLFWACGVAVATLASQRRSSTGSTPLVRWLSEGSPPGPSPGHERSCAFSREFTAAAPDELTAFCGVTTAPDGTTPIVAIILCYAGSVSEGERLVKPVKEFDPPIMDHIGPLPYLAQQSMLDASAPPGKQNYWKSDFLKELSDSAVATIVEYCGPALPSPASLVLFEHLHGAAKRNKDEAAFAQRDSDYNLVIASAWTDLSENEKQIKWTRDFAAAMKPFASGGVYVTNFFHLNANIKPTG